MGTPKGVFALTVNYLFLSSLSSASKGASLKVRLGEHDVTTNQEALRHEEYDVASVVPYPGFNNGTLAHDIALVRLRHPAKRRANIDVVCVPKQGSLFPETTNDTSCVITGWGRKNEGQFTKWMALSAFLKALLITRTYHWFE
uniref:Peptidase S1 domain-containing protein n=1 Tax=Timema poppense TaxID=170557 RepID=A0A7R9D2B6_TIMPO|nr:unnamed protein product [Timema poppensis]